MRTKPVGSTPPGTARGDTGNPESSNLRFGLVDWLLPTAFAYSIEDPDPPAALGAGTPIPPAARGVRGVPDLAPGRPNRLSMTSAAVLSFGVIGIAAPSAGGRPLEILSPGPAEAAPSTVVALLAAATPSPGTRTAEE